MIISNQCWKKLCCLIFFGTGDIFQHSLRNKNLKRTVFIQNRNLVLINTPLFKSLGSVNSLLFFLLIILFRKDVLNG